MNDRIYWAALALGSALAFSSMPLLAQEPPTEKGVKGNFNEVSKIEPTEARLAKLKLPTGFHINVFAMLENPRTIAVADDGTVYVSQREPGQLAVLRDTDDDGVADVQRVVAKKEQLHGVTIHDNYVYFTTIKEVYRAERKPDGLLGEPELLVSGLPDAGQHPNRTLAFGPDGMLYITVGSTTNVAVENNPENATILRVDPNNWQRSIFASGLRNTIGFGWHPTSKRMFGFDHGIDWLGNDDPEEELNEIKQGAKYGWPFVYNKSKIYPHLEVPPKFGMTKQEWAQTSVEPTLMYRAHSAPLQMAFYTGTQFPAEYRNDAFETMRGSWNRKPASGYEVVRVHFGADGTPESIMPFLTGFLVPKGKDGHDAHIGRPVGVATLPDGSLLVGDDTNNTIYRITYGNSGVTARKSPLLSSDLAPKILNAKKSLTVESPDFTNGGRIPIEFTDHGAGASPRLRWSGALAGTKSFAILLEDPDALSPKPFVHWLAANLPPSLMELPSNLPKEDKPGALSNGIQGGTNQGTVGYYGPRPPAQDPEHHYHFQVFAFDAVLDLPSGFNRVALLKAMQGHILSYGETVGVFKK